MINIKPAEARAAPGSASSGSIVSLISKGLREMRTSADADFELLRNRANSIFKLADQGVEHFINSASFTVPTVTASATTTPAEIEFVKKLRPKISEFRRAYSSPDFKWGTKGKLRIDLSAFRNAIAPEGEEENESERWRTWRRLRFTEGGGKEEGQSGEFSWEPIKAFQTRCREIEAELKTTSSSPAEILEGIKNSEFVEKVKSSLVSKILLLLVASITI